MRGNCGGTVVVGGRLANTNWQAHEQAIKIRGPAHIHKFYLRCMLRTMMLAINFPTRHPRRPTEGRQTGGVGLRDLHSAIAFLSARRRPTRCRQESRPGGPANASKVSNIQHREKCYVCEFKFACISLLEDRMTHRRGLSGRKGRRGEAPGGGGGGGAPRCDALAHLDIHRRMRVKKATRVSRSMNATCIAGAASTHLAAAVAEQDCPRTSLDRVCENVKRLLFGRRCRIGTIRP